MGPDQISEYLKNVQAENSNEWQEQDARKSQYMWKTPLRGLQWAKQIPVDSAIRFSTYSEFIR
jgi:hypothetical protein